MSRTFGEMFSVLSDPFALVIDLRQLVEVMIDCLEYRYVV